jgi:hypothetical protein
MMMIRVGWVGLPEVGSGFRTIREHQQEMQDLKRNMKIKAEDYENV